MRYKIVEEKRADGATKYIPYVKEFLIWKAIAKDGNLEVQIGRNRYKPDYFTRASALMAIKDHKRQADQMKRIEKSRKVLSKKVEYIDRIEPWS